MYSPASNHTSSKSTLFYVQHGHRDRVKPCPHCRKKVPCGHARLCESCVIRSHYFRPTKHFQKQFGDSPTFLQQSHFSATNCRTFVRQCGQALRRSGAIVLPFDDVKRNSLQWRREGGQQGADSPGRHSGGSKTRVTTGAKIC